MVTIINDQISCAVFCFLDLAALPFDGPNLERLQEALKSLSQAVSGLVKMMEEDVYTALLIRKEAEDFTQLVGDEYRRLLTEVEIRMGSLLERYRDVNEQEREVEAGRERVRLAQRVADASVRNGVIRVATSTVVASGVTAGVAWYVKVEILRSILTR